MVYASIHPRGTKISIDPNAFHGKEITKWNGHQDKRTSSSDKNGCRGIIDVKPSFKNRPFANLKEANNWH